MARQFTLQEERDMLRRALAAETSDSGLKGVRHTMWDWLASLEEILGDVIAWGD